MSITKLNIHNVRNIDKAQIIPHPRFNIISGVNGSGKTSILEAIYLLGNGRSFRTRETAPLVNYAQQELTVFAEIDAEDTLSIQKSKTGSTIVKLNQQSFSRSSELAKFLPCQVVYQDIFQIIDAGPVVRRSLLDWGCFYRFSEYSNLLKEYKHIVKQRNALLRQKAPLASYSAWNNLLVEKALIIDEMRGKYFLRLQKSFQSFLAKLTETHCTISYYKGWNKKGSDKSLAEILDEQFASDMQRQYTHAGAHNADILFDSVELKAKQTLSRGQQKIILIALKLAQASLLDAPCVYLLDDITSELDFKHISNLLDLLIQLDGQFFLTTIDAKVFMDNAKLSGSKLISLLR